MYVYAWKEKRQHACEELLMASYLTQSVFSHYARLGKREVLLVSWYKRLFISKV